MMNKKRHIVYSLNRIGARPNLEDAISPAHGDLFIVCDGVGGSSAGEIASGTAVNSFWEIFHERTANILSLRDFETMVDDAAALFVRNIRNYISNNPASQNTSTTLTLAVIKDDKAYIAWCGDSRIYHVRNGKILFRTRDHSLVEELLSKGVINEQEAANHPQRNVIVRSLTANTLAGDIQTSHIDGLLPGDWLLLCSDGLLEQFNEAEIGKTLKQRKPGVDYGSIIDALCTGRTKDNYSMHLVNFGGAKSKSTSRLLRYALGFIALALIAIFAFKLYPDSLPDQPVLPGQESKMQERAKQDTARSAFKKAPLPPKANVNAADTINKSIKKTVNPLPDTANGQPGKDSITRK